MRKAVLGVGAIVLMFTLTGCFNGANEVGGVRTNTDSGWVTAQDVRLPDGRTVVCVMSNTKISCDWEKAK